MIYPISGTANLNGIDSEAGAVILKIAYGYTIEPHNRDPLVDLADEALVQFSLAAAPGAWLVDVLPFCAYLAESWADRMLTKLVKHLPGWLPGTDFKRTAQRWRETLTDLTERPYAFVRQQMAQGKYEPSFVSKVLEQGNMNLSPE